MSRKMLEEAAAAAREIDRAFPETMLKMFVQMGDLLIAAVQNDSPVAVVKATRIRAAMEVFADAIRELKVSGNELVGAIEDFDKETR